MPEQNKPFVVTDRRKFTMDGELPPAGTGLTSRAPETAEEKPIGELTSVSRIELPTGTIQLGLGYIRREAIERNQPIQYPNGTAIPITLTYRP